jgi:quercetin dioxygenase-like cupin family protein
MTVAASGGARTYPSGAYSISGKDGEVRWMGKTRTRFLASGDTTNNRFGLVDETALKGESVPMHRHEDIESFFVIEGSVAFCIEEEWFKGGPGAFLHIPGGTVHGFRIVSDRARYLIHTTGHHVEFYRAISVPSGANGKPASQDVDWDRVLRAAEEYGIELVGNLPSLE